MNSARSAGRGMSEPKITGLPNFTRLKPIQIPAVSRKSVSRGDDATGGTGRTGAVLGFEAADLALLPFFTGAALATRSRAPALPGRSCLIAFGAAPTA